MGVFIDNIWKTDDKVANAFDEHKSKIIDSYILWKNNIDTERVPYTEARTCVEHILKALVVKYFEVTEFEKSDYQKLENKKFFPEPYKAFGVVACLFLITKNVRIDKHNKLLTNTLNGYINDVNDTAVIHTHKKNKIASRERQEIDYKLYLIVDCFFKDQNEEDWYEKYISEHLNDLNSILKTLEEVKKHTESMSSDTSTQKNDAEITKSINSKNKRKKRIILISLIIFIVIVGVKLYNTESYLTIEIDGENNPKTFDILILPFINTENNVVTPIGTELTDRFLSNINLLRQATTVKYLDTYKGHISPKTAHELGVKMGMDMVIWGKESTRVNDSTHYVSFWYEPISFNMQTNHIVYGKYGGVSNVIQIKRLMDISDNKKSLVLDDVVYWGEAEYFRGKREHYKALMNLLMLKEKDTTFQDNNLTEYLADCYYSLNKTPLGDETFEEAIKNNPTAKLHESYAQVLATRGTIFLKKEDSLQKKIILKAKEHFEKAVNLDSTNYKLINYVGGFLNHVGEYSEAKVYFEKAMRVPNIKNDENLITMVYTNYANLLSYHSKEFDKANLYYKLAINKMPSNYILSSYADFLYIHRLNLDSAKYYYEVATKGIRIDQGGHTFFSLSLDPSIYFNYALLLSNEFGEKEKARLFLKEKVDIYYSNENQISFKSSDLNYYYSLFLYRIMNDKETAEKQYQITAQNDLTNKITRQKFSEYKVLKPIHTYE